MSKVVENSFRDINIAFANELAKICHESGLDVYEIIKIANSIHGLIFFPLALALEATVYLSIRGFWLVIILALPISFLPHAK